MKQKLRCLAFLLGAPLLLNAQNVGIGTNTPNASAKLEIADANRGFLFPRVSLTATNVAAPVTAPANWLVVFNTVSAGAGATAVSPGLYYWDGTQWVRFSTTQSNDWTLLGNAGTTPATNFIGTTDAQDFVTRTNNTERMRVTSAGNIGMGTAAPDQLLELANGGMQINGDWGIGFNGAAPIGGLNTGDAAKFYYDQNFGGVNLDFLVIEKTDPNNLPADGGIAFTNIGSDNIRVPSLVIRGSGAVGVGTVTPAHQLDINPATSPIWTSNGWRGLVGLNDAGAVGWRNGTGGLSAGFGHTSNGTPSPNDDALCFFSTNSALGTNGSPANYSMRIFDANNQIAINNGGASTPDATAQVEITSTSRGLLIPRVALTQTTNISPVAVTPTTSLLVYNTATVNDVSPGFYFWNGTNWVRFQTSNTNNWTLLGNAGTNPATNFIGTSDAQDFVARTSNTERMRITSAGNLGVGTATPNTLFQVNAGASTANMNPAAISVNRAATNVEGSLWFMTGGASRWILQQDNDNTENLRLWSSALGQFVQSWEHSTGNVGIGTGSNVPASRLQIAGGDTRIGELSNGVAAGYGRYLHFSGGGNVGSGDGDNSDPLWVSRFNVASDRSELRVNTGDEINTGDAFVVGAHNGSIAGSPWTPVLTANSNGNTTVHNLAGVGNRIVMADAAGTLFASSVNTTAWSLLGNSGTNAATNFIGTTDAQDFVTRTNNTERMRVTNTGNVGIGVAAPSVRFQVVGGDMYLGNSAAVSAVFPQAGPRLLLGGDAGQNTDDVFFQRYYTASDQSALRVSIGDNNAGDDRFEVGNGTWTPWLTVLNSGRVGINNNAPAEALHVVGNIRSSTLAGAGNRLVFADLNGTLTTSTVNATAWSLVGNSATNPATNFVGTTDAQDFVTRTNNAERMRVTSAGNVGIGTNAPAARLQVTGGAIRPEAGDISAAGINWGANLFGGGGDEPYIRYFAKAGESTRLMIANQNDADDDVTLEAGFLLFRTGDGGTTIADADRMIITTAGSVGIGTNSPGQLLGVNGGIQSMDYGGAGTVNVQVGDDAYFSDLDLANTIGLRTAVDFANLSLGSNNQGMVGGGTADYVHNVGTQNFGTGGRYIIAASQSLAGAANAVGETGGMFADGNAVSLWSPGDANGGQPSALVYFMDEDFWDNTNTNPYDNTALKSYINGAGALVSASDMRRKNTITPITNALARIMNIGGYEYFFNLAPAEIEKGDKAPLQSGVLAQELQKEFPTAVEQSKDGKDMYVNYSAMTPYLIEAIKEQQRQIEALQKRIEELEKRQK